MHRSIDGHYFSLVSPWAYIGHATLRESDAASQFGREF